MRLDTLRMIVGFLIIGSHLLCLGMIIFYMSGLTIQEKTDLSLLIGPVFSVYVAAIVKRFTQANPTYDDTPTHPALRILSIGAAVIFSLAIPATLFNFAVGQIGEVATLKTYLGFIETGLGIYTGAIVDRLFGGREQVTDRTRRRGRIAPVP